MSERRKLRKFGRAQKEIPEFKTIMLHPKRRKRSQQEDDIAVREREVRVEKEQKPSARAEE